MISKLEVPPLLKKFVEFYFYLSNKFLKCVEWGGEATLANILMKAQSKCASGLRIRNSDLSVKIYAYLKMHLLGKVLFTRSMVVLFYPDISKCKILHFEVKIFFCLKLPNSSRKSTKTILQTFFYILKCKI